MARKLFMDWAIARVAIVFYQWGLASVTYPLVQEDASKDHSLETIVLKIHMAMLDPKLFHAI